MDGVTVNKSFGLETCLEIVIIYEIAHCTFKFEFENYASCVLPNFQFKSPSQFNSAVDVINTSKPDSVSQSPLPLHTRDELMSMKGLMSSLQPWVVYHPPL